VNGTTHCIGPAEAQARAAGRLGTRRLEHSRRVAELAAYYAGLYGASRDEALVAGWLHDLCRDVTADEILRMADESGVPVGTLERGHPVGLLHAPVAAAELRAAGLDERVARAVELHTVGGPGMDALAKCLYLADFCEPERDFDGLDEVRRLAERSLDAAVAAAARVTLLDVIARERGVHPGALALYNEHYAAR
jgi:predicted HD superfamily hydrolase involved in NAD metabolism